MANKEKVDIKRSDQFQEMDEELTRAMEELDCTIDRVSLIFQSESPEAGMATLTEENTEAPEPAEAQQATGADGSPAPAGERASE